MTTVGVVPGQLPTPSVIISLVQRERIFFSRGIHVICHGCDNKLPEDPWKETYPLQVEIVTKAEAFKVTSKQIFLTRGTEFLIHRQAERRNGI